MNALRAFSATLHSFARPGAAIAAGVLLSGCVHDPFPNARIDPKSSVGAEVARINRTHTRSPSFAQIPRAPRDIRPLAQYGRAAGQLTAARDQVLAATADNTWTLSNSESFAATARSQAGPDLPPPSPSNAEDFAKALRERATPPPPR